MLLVALFGGYAELLKKMLTVEKSKVQVAVSQREEIEALVKEQRSTILKLQKASVGAPHHRKVRPEGEGDGRYPPQVDEVMAELVWLRERQRAIEAQAQTGAELVFKPYLCYDLTMSFLSHTCTWSVFSVCSPRPAGCCSAGRCSYQPCGGGADSDTPCILLGINAVRRRH
jgi:hypothetical protein